MTAVDHQARRGRGPGAPGRARVVNRHAILFGTLLVVLPNALFALHLSPWPAAAVLMGCAATLALASQRMAPGSVLEQPIAPLRLVACLVCAALLIALGGEGHLVFANVDWLWRDAVLADLARAPFPPTYLVDGHAAVLRAPLGMYMVPAAVASVTGLGWGHAVLFAQNAAILSLVLYGVATLAGRAALLVCSLFLFFSGLDIVGQWLSGPFVRDVSASQGLPSHIETWLPGLQYSSVITQIFWVPNHALPSFWLTLLAWACRRGEVSPGSLLAVAGACLFWSPFAVIGALPFGLYLLITSHREVLASSRFWMGAAAAACFLPVAWYLQSDAAKVPHALMVFEPLWWLVTAVFLLVEIPYALILLLVWRQVPHDLRGLSGVAIVFLIVLPFLRFGQNNDLGMRASIPALMLLAIALAQALRAGGRRLSGPTLAAALLLIIGAATPAMEILRAFTFAPFSISDCNLVTVWKKLEPKNPTLANYLASPSPSLRALFGDTPPVLVPQPSTICWPDFPFDPRLSVGEHSNADLDQSHRGLAVPGL